ncbi:MAG: RNA polymerase sigma factor [Desulfomonilaceae bacterium]
MSRLATLSDEQLIEEAIKGSEAHFDVLVERYTPQIYRLARGITNSHSEAEDVVQETFLKIFKNLNKFSSDKANFKTWALTIARNQSINTLASIKRKALQFFGDRENDDPEPDFSFNPMSSEVQDAETLMSLKQRFYQLEGALKKIPERQKTALILKTQENMSYEEIANVMSVSVSSVESLIFRGRKKLIELLEK